MVGTGKLTEFTHDIRVPLAGDLLDETIAGSGTVVNIHFIGEWDGKSSIVLQPGQEAEARGTLQGVRVGDHHTDRAHITVRPIVECPVKDDDPWDGKSVVQQPGPCYSTPVVANVDDWNAVRDPSLTSTGSAVAGAIVAVMVLALLTVGLLLVRRGLIKQHKQNADYAQKVFSRTLGEEHTCPEEGDSDSEGKAY